MFVQSTEAYILDTVQNVDLAMVVFVDFLSLEGFEVADLWKAYAAVARHLADFSPLPPCSLPRQSVLWH